jgi:hypothetical protein
MRLVDRVLSLSAASVRAVAVKRHMASNMYILIATTADQVLAFEKALLITIMLKNNLQQTTDSARSPAS